MTTANELARTFARILRTHVGAENMAEVIARNAAEPDGSNVCHSHDFCDANEAILEALAEHGLEIFPEDSKGDYADGADEAITDLCNEAWNLAKAAGFYAGEEP